MISTAAMSAINDTEVLANKSATNFFGIIVNAPVKVMVQQSGHEGIQVSAVGNDAQHLFAEVINGSLIIYSDGAPLSKLTTITIDMQECNLLQTATGASIETKGMLQSDFLMIKANGRSTINAMVLALKLGVIAKGQSSIAIEGVAAESFLKTSANGKIATSSLKSAKAFNYTAAALAISKTDSKRKALSAH
jgi:hypothetical protein